MTWIWINCSYWSKTQRHIKKQSDWSSRQVLNLAITPNFNVGCLPINQKFRNFQDGVKWCGTFPENRKTGSTFSISKEDSGFWNSLWQMKKHFRQFFKTRGFPPISTTCPGVHFCYQISLRVSLLSDMLFFFVTSLKPSTRHFPFRRSFAYFPL